MKINDTDADGDDVQCLTPVVEEAVTKELKKVENRDKKRSKYNKTSDEEKTEIGRYVTSMVCQQS